MDEFRYSHNFSGEFLKLLGGEPLLVSQKYAKDHITISNLMGLILSNTLLEDKNKDITDALIKRLHVIEFKNVIIKNNIDINKCLFQEEAEIIIFCNKLYFSMLKKPTTRSPRIKTKHTQKTASLTHKNVTSFSIFKFLYDTTGKYTIKKKYLTETEFNKDVISKFNKKFNRHYNGKFLIIETDNGITRMDKEAYLTYNSSKPDHFEKLNSIDGNDQFINLDYTCIMNTSVSKEILKESNKQEDLELAQKLHKSITENNYTEKIENILNTGYNSFENCMKYTNGNVKNCYTTLFIEHGQNTELIFKLFFYKYY
jgi:hypothetical protein